MARRTIRNVAATAVATTSILTLALGGCAGKRPIAQVRESGQWQETRGDYAAAAREYQEIVDRYPGDWQAQYRLGACQLELDQPARARQSLELAHDLRPGNENVIDALAEAMYRQDESSKLFEFLRAESRRTQSVRAHLRLAHYAMALGDLDSAKVALDTAIVIDDGQSSRPYVDAARFAEEVGDLDLAVRRLRQAYGIAPDDPEISERLVALGEIPGPTIALPPGQ